MDTTDTFDERIERLEQELALALKWDRPSILLVVYVSEFTRAEAEERLESWAQGEGMSVAHVHITSPADPAADLPRTLYEWPDRERTVFFVSGLGAGAPTTWNSLNLRREYLVRGRIRAVFWLTEGEAAALPLEAPDFWVFRHLTLEFLEMPPPERVLSEAGRMAWERLEARLPPEERRARIALREGLLRELPAGPESDAARADLHYTLGGLYYWEKDYERAREHFQAALDLAERVGNERLRAWALNGLGNVYSDLGRYEEAIGAYEKAIELDPKFAYPWNGLGNVYYQQGRYEEAIGSLRKAIELDPMFAYPWNGLGIVYRHLGRYE
ncbi:MAG: hypothetical protein DRI80_17020, partial [Chloroflexota bacterium]